MSKMDFTIKKSNNKEEESLTVSYDSPQYQQITSKCPDLDEFSCTPDDSLTTDTKEKIVADECSRDSKSSSYLDVLAWLILIFAMIAILSVLLLSNNCRPRILDNNNSHIYTHKVEIDSTFIEDKGITCTHGELINRYTGWHIISYYIIVVISLSVVLVFISKALIQYWGKIRDCEKKLQEQKYKDGMRIYNEDCEFKRLHYKTKMLLYEKREKMKMDEWIRDNEHNRKMCVKEQECVAELSKVLLEIAKIKNIISIKIPESGDKTVIIEKSVLSEDKLEDLKDIAKAFTNNDIYKS